MRRKAALFLLIPVAAACSQTGVSAPSLAPRPGETIDPRLPVETASTGKPADPALLSRLSALVTEARAGEAAFERAAAQAERLVAGASGPRSESWVAAQQAISVAVAARAPTTSALGDIDEMAAATVTRAGWIDPADRAAIEAAAEEVWRLANGQAMRIDALRARLGG